MQIKILFLVNSRLISSDELSGGVRIPLPWIDAMVDELRKKESISIAIALPSDKSFMQKKSVNGVVIYGLPDFKRKDVFTKTIEHLIKREETNEINRHALDAIEDFNPDIIQVFGSENPFGLISQMQHRPVVLYIQGFLSIVLEKWYAGITKWDQFRYASGKNLLLRCAIFNEYNEVSSRAKREREILENCKFFIGRTDFDKRIVSLLSPGSKYFHCEEFIRKEFFKVRWENSLGIVVKIISILKGTSYKGIELLVETMLLLKMHSSWSFELNICGVNDEEEIVDIVKRKYGHKSLDNINFIGKQGTNELIAVMCDSDIYLHPSYIENSPNSVCEAMILGMPIISTNVGGVTSLITDKVEGVLLQEGEPYSMAGAILELVNNYEFARLLGENARNRSIRRHNPELIGQRLIEVYTEILK